MSDTAVTIKEFRRTKSEPQLAARPLHLLQPPHLLRIGRQIRLLDDQLYAFPKGPNEGIWLIQLRGYPFLSRDETQLAPFRPLSPTAFSSHNLISKHERERGSCFDNEEISLKPQSCLCLGYGTE
jgi:hypothetical protein